MMIDEVGLLTGIRSGVDRATSLSWVWVVDCGYWRRRGEARSKVSPGDARVDIAPNFFLVGSAALIRLAGAETNLAEKGNASPLFRASFLAVTRARFNAIAFRNGPTDGRGNWRLKNVSILILLLM